MSFIPRLSSPWFALLSNRGLGRREESFANIIITSTMLPPDRWHVVTLTYDGSVARLYLDGEMIDDYWWGSGHGIYRPSSSHLCMFKCPNGISFNGYIDDLTLWNRTLSQGEIRALNYLDRGMKAIIAPRPVMLKMQ